MPSTFAEPLTPSPSSSTSPFSFHRRGSIRRGTISSISKDVRVNDFVEIIKQQKLIQQKERSLSGSSLKRRHSMFNLKPTTSRVKSPISPSVSAAPAAPEVPVEAITSNCTTIANVCEKEEFNEPLPSSINPSSSITTTSTFNENSDITLLNHLASDFMTLVKDLQAGDQNKIRQGQYILRRQQQLLNQLLLEKTNTTSTIITTTSTTVQKPWESMLSYFSPSASTTTTVIKQTPDSTTYSLQGICTTTDPTLIPQQFLPDMHTNSKIYQLPFSVDISYSDQKTKFIPTLHWQKDADTEQCHDEKCQSKFTWYQRKHHCRRCGYIYCHTHSSNRLPLFSCPSKQPEFSRVCDACFFSLVSLHSPPH